MAEPARRGVGEVMRPWAETVVRKAAGAARMEVVYFILKIGTALVREIDDRRGLIEKTAE
jgi:hypothetical protein